MELKTILVASTIAVAATTAVAHKGATGMLLERMNGMLAMGRATKEITPMMRGQQDYEVDRTIAYAAVLQAHSGEAMLALFPEGMNASPSAAKDEIWSNWDEFSTLANELEIYAAALDQAAANGLGESTATDNSMMGGDTSMMMGNDSSTMMEGADQSSPTLEMLAEMPVNMVFVQTAQVCSACHTKFRVEE